METKKPQIIVGSDLFMILRGGIARLALGIYACGTPMPRRNYMNNTSAESCFSGFRSEHLLFGNLPFIVISYRTLGNAF